MSIGRKVRQAGSGPLEDQPDYHDQYVQNWWIWTPANHPGNGTPSAWE
jgi:hypothetical protein